VVIVNVGIAFSNDLEVNHAVTGNLIEHVVQEGHARGKLRFASTIQIEGNLDLGF
jgi:hypothetical protein